MPYSRRVAGLFVCLLLANAQVASAQRIPSDSAEVEPAPVFTTRDAVYTGIAAGASIVIMQYDERIFDYLADSSLQGNEFLGDGADLIALLNEKSLFALGVVGYAVGKLADAPSLADIAFHATEALIISSAVNTVLRGTLGRARPFISNGDDAFLFDPFSGFGDLGYRAFPSIHASAGFSVAAALTTETAYRNPEALWYVAPIAYAIGALPGIARVYNSKHWASDIPMGAVLGTLTGIRVVRYHHTRPGNWLDDIFLSTAIVPDGRGGVRVIISRTF
ncbi:MAG: phosphatase PAP2 family protein [Gemmatimonadaceae bacterium]